MLNIVIILPGLTTRRQLITLENGGFLILGATFNICVSVISVITHFIFYTSFVLFVQLSGQ